MSTLILPRGIGVKQFSDSRRVKIPQMLERFSSNRFSGYLAFEFSTQSGSLCFQDGHMVAVLFKGADERYRGHEALLELFRALHQESALIRVYRLESEFVPYLVRMFNGSVVFEAQLIRFLDTERLLAYLQQEHFSGCLQIYTATEAVLIFYAAGAVEGFFADGSAGLQDKLDVEHSLAAAAQSRYDLIRDPDAGKGGAIPLTEGNFEKDWLLVWRELNL